jgi:hypothetical protein
VRLPRHLKVEKHNVRRISNRCVKPGEIKPAGFPIGSKDSHVVGALITTVQESARGVEVEAPRIAAAGPFLADQFQFTIFPNREDPDAVVQPIAGVQKPAIT